MKTPGQTTNSPYFGAIHAIPDDSYFNAKGVPCEGDIYASSVFLGANSWYDKENPGRPYMCIIGECRSIKGRLPYEVTELTFEEGKGIDVDIYYEFSDDELANMVKKGLFKPGFKCPEEMYSNVLEMPITCNFTVVAPQTDTNVPILFADIANKQHIVTNSKDCGYTFGDYFKEAVAPQAEDDFIDFTDVEVEHDLLAQPEDEIKDDEIIVNHGPSEEEKEIDKYYNEIHERVIEDHLNKPDTKAEAEVKVLNPTKAEDDTKDELIETTPAEAKHDAEAEYDAFIVDMADADKHDAKAEHDALISDMTDADELIRNGAIADLDEDRDYRMDVIDELFKQDPETVIDRMVQVASFEPSVADVVERAKAEAKRMASLQEAAIENDNAEDNSLDSDSLDSDKMKSKKAETDLHTNLIHKQVPQHLQEIAEKAQDDGFEDALE